MHDTNAHGATRATLQYVLSSEMPTHHKSILIALLTQALRDEDEQAREGLAPKIPAEWRSEETQKLQVFLEGRVATSWQHADEVLMRLAADLHRTPYDVRSKATEIGYAAGVDYAVARTQARARAALDDQ